MKCVTNIFSKIPVARNSHVRGWSEYWSYILNAEIYHGNEFSQFSTIYIDHGVNFSGTLNLFGGISDELVERLEALIEFKGEIISLDIPMPDYGAQLIRRIGNASTSKKLTSKITDAMSKLQKIKSITGRCISKKTGRLTIGDSHATAFAPWLSGIDRMNGKTLYSHLQNYELKYKEFDYLNSLTLVFGSVDIRHHLCRQPSPFVALRCLLISYKTFINSLPRHLKIEVATPVPVECEHRKIPKTGYYKGTPFYGSQALRSRLTKRMVSKLKEFSRVTIVSPPPFWYDLDPAEYASKYMERGGSVHISPEFYRSKTWGEF